MELSPDSSLPGWAFPFHVHFYITVSETKKSYNMPKKWILALQQSNDCNGSHYKIVHKSIPSERKRTINL